MFNTNSVNRDIGAELFQDRAHGLPVIAAYIVRDHGVRVDDLHNI